MQRPRFVALFGEGKAAGMAQHVGMRLEAELKTKGLNAPHLTPADIDAVIVGEDYHVFPGTTMTVCALKLRNGFVVVGESAAASPENFDEAIGRRIARENARSRIWALEDYVLRERLSK